LVKIKNKNKNKKETYLEVDEKAVDQILVGGAHLDSGACPHSRTPRTRRIAAASRGLCCREVWRCGGGATGRSSACCGAAPSSSPSSPSASAATAAHSGSAPVEFATATIGFAAAPSHPLHLVFVVAILNFLIHFLLRLFLFLDIK
jgi:hypothetical protein